jgi:RNA 3'-terminal phosphate cyclase
MKELITIDGSMGEGGGQVLRTSLSLAAITGHELALTKIRAGRDKPGLKRQHLTCVRAVANEVVHQVREFLKSGKACEKHLADQLLVPLHLLVGGHTERGTEGFWEDEVWHPNWDVAVQKETLHYKTNKDVITQFAESIRP